MYVSAVTAVERMGGLEIFLEVYKANLRASMERNRAILKRLDET